MAVSGAGGWIPSNGICVRNDKLLIGPIAQNKPPEIVCKGDGTDDAEILRRLDTGAIVQVDIRGGTIARIAKIVEAQNRSDTK